LHNKGNTIAVELLQIKGLLLFVALVETAVESFVPIKTGSWLSVGSTTGTAYYLKRHKLTRLEFCLLGGNLVVL
jgi:hypothetical protein